MSYGEFGWILDGFSSRSCRRILEAIQYTVEVVKDDASVLRNGCFCQKTLPAPSLYGLVMDSEVFGKLFVASDDDFLFFHI